MRNAWLTAVFVLACQWLSAQDISLFQQFNGRYDFTFVGNTLNPFPNNTFNSYCHINSQSTANLNLFPDQTIVAAFLYWAGSGPGDFDVALNGTSITSQRNFLLHHGDDNLPYFCAFADVTDFITTTGNGDYTLSGLDISPWIESGGDYCSNRTNFAGWSLVIIYEDPDLPLNQLNIYDGLQGVPLEITIQLDNLNVIDNDGARIGFVAWEGDADLGINEKLTINDDELSNPPLNPLGNCFNSTNSFTGSNLLFNMDLDYYDIQNHINIGDTAAEIKLTSGEQRIGGGIAGDFVMISTVVTKLNSQLPDATVEAVVSAPVCNSRELTLDYTVYNVNSTDTLPANTPVAIYIEGTLYTVVHTQANIPIGGSEPGSITMTIPAGIPDDFTITLQADDDGTGNGTVTETDETNNRFDVSAALLPIPELPELSPLTACNIGLTRAVFDLSEVVDQLEGGPVRFFESEEDAANGTNAIADYTNYTAAATPMRLFVRLDSEPCFAIGEVELRSRNCPPTVYNFISANGDGKNDVFTIKGLYDIFMNFRLFIYNRWGTLVWEGNNYSGKWDGQGNFGIRLDSEKVPDGTYYYILELNDPGYPEPLNGFLYITR